MIKIPKKQLYSLSSLFNLTKRYSALKIFFHASFLLLFYLALPFYLLFNFRLHIGLLFIFYLFLAAIIYYSLKKFLKSKFNSAVKTQEYEEKINTFFDQVAKENTIRTALDFKINRYNSLKDIIQQINIKFDLTSIEENLVSTALSQISRQEGVCLLYLVDAPNQRLHLFATRSNDPQLVIKAKEGDIFDKWVLRHTSALLIEDIRKDFRFDVEKIHKEHRRNISSLISSPLVSEEKMLGIIRLDSPLAQFFSQDDLRFLNTISDLGAVALENFELFNKTQDLAIRDDLTSLYRKGYFLERFKDEFSRSLQKQQDISLLMIDIDHFKDYNDKFGHTAGDIVLKSISKEIFNFFNRESVIPCRFGGEEFCVLLPGINKKSAVTFAQQFRKLIEKKEIVLRRQKSNITISIGVASYPQDAGTQDELLHKSDQLLYEAKEKGRNRVCST